MYRLQPHPTDALKMKAPVLFTIHLTDTASTKHWNKCKWIQRRTSWNQSIQYLRIAPIYNFKLAR